MKRFYQTDVALISRHSSVSHQSPPHFFPSAFPQGRGMRHAQPAEEEIGEVFTVLHSSRKGEGKEKLFLIFSVSVLLSSGGWEFWQRFG